MNTSVLNSFRLYTVFLFTAFVISCQQEESEFNAKKLQELTKPSAENVHQILVSTQEILDITSNVLEEEGISIEGGEISPDNCTPALRRQYIQDKTHYDTIIYAGTITIDYGSGSDCIAAGPVRTGQIKDVFTYIINYKNGTTFSVEQDISFENFKRDDMALNGRFTTLASSGTADSLKTISARIDYQHGVFVIWNAALANKRLDPATPEDDRRTVTGTVSGFTHDNNYFSGVISNPVIYNYNCSDGSMIPVQGTVEMKVNGWSAIVDYGNGVCDRFYSVTIGDNSMTYSF